MIGRLHEHSEWQEKSSKMICTLKNYNLQLVIFSPARNGAHNWGRVCSKFLISSPFSWGRRKGLVGGTIFQLHAPIICHRWPRLHTTQIPELLISKKCHTIVIGVRRHTIHAVSSGILSKKSAVTDGAYPKIVTCTCHGVMSRDIIEKVIPARPRLHKTVTINECRNFILS